MTSETSRSLTVFALAKINLYLHVTDKLANGYHTLDSLISFADIGDEIIIEPAQDFQFEITGPFSAALKGNDIAAGPDSSNLAVKAVWGLSRLIEKAPSLHMRLVKNLPLGAGIGGGSADAAAVLWGLLEYWSLPKNLSGLDDLMLKLGADVPVCFACEPCRVQGIGDILKSPPALPEAPVVLVYPGKPCHTAKIFNHMKASFSLPADLPEIITSFEMLCDVLSRTTNDLTQAAMDSVPDIKNVLQALDAQPGCALSRMSGSGSSCFGFFEDEQKAEAAALKLAEENPDWWVKSSWLGRCGRY